MNIKILLTSTVLALGSFTAASYAQAATLQYCNPNYHSCEAPFTLNKDKIAPDARTVTHACNPNNHSCEAPFNLTPGQIAKQTGSTSHYCNPNYHSCEAPFNL